MYGIRIVDTQTIVDFPFKSESHAQDTINENCIFKSAYEPVEITEDNAKEFHILPISGLRNL